MINESILRVATIDYLLLILARQVASSPWNKLQSVLESAASQVVPSAPWRIAVEALESDRVQQAVKNIKDGVRSPQAQTTADQQRMFSTV